MHIGKPNQDSGVIASARIKSDKIDAKILAHLLRSNLVAEIFVPDWQTREMRSLVTHRASPVRTGSGMKDKVHSIIGKYGLHHEFSDIFGKAATKWLSALRRSVSMIVMESSSVWYDIYRYLNEEKNLDVVLSNPIKTKTIASAKIKTDSRMVLSGLVFLKKSLISWVVVFYF